MKAWKALTKRILLCGVLMLSFQSMGCVSFRHSSPYDSLMVSNCDRQTVYCEPDHSVECCELYAVSDVAGNAAKRWMSRFRPVAAWPAQRCGAMKASVCNWVNEKKAAANAPPWPRFHPVPTKPVFESDQSEQAEEAMSPEVYGRFGKG
jgi:hypothetical protein